MGQIIEINTSGYCVLYRGGYDTKERKGLDPFNRKREPLNLDLSDAWNETVSQGMLLHYHSERTSSKEEICEFFNIDPSINCSRYVECNLKCVFTNDNRIILYRNTDEDPVKVTKSVKYRTKEYVFWTDYSNYYSEGPFEFTYWKFDKNVKYLVFDIDWKYLYRLLPIEYDRLEISELNNRYKHLEAVQRIFELNPIDLNNSWDYNGAQKKLIEKAKEEKRERERKAIEELEIRKNTPGYCSCCGSKYADYIDDPYIYDMYGVSSKCWLCPDCAHESAMDV